MPGSPTTPGRPGTRARAPLRVAFRDLNRVGTRDLTSFAAQWLACALPCRRFAVTLAGANARLGAEMVSLRLPRGGLAPPPCRSRGALRLSSSYYISELLEALLARALQRLAVRGRRLRLRADLNGKTPAVLAADAPIRVTLRLSGLGHAHRKGRFADATLDPLCQHLGLLLR